MVVVWTGEAGAGGSLAIPTGDPDSGVGEDGSDLMSISSPESESGSSGMVIVWIQTRSAKVASQLNSVEVFEIKALSICNFLFAMK